MNELARQPPAAAGPQPLPRLLEYERFLLEALREPGCYLHQTPPLDPTGFVLKKYAKVNIPYGGGLWTDHSVLLGGYEPDHVRRLFELGLLRRVVYDGRETDAWAAARVTTVVNVRPLDAAGWLADPDHVYVGIPVPRSRWPGSGIVGPPRRRFRSNAEVYNFTEPYRNALDADRDDGRFLRSLPPLDAAFFVGLRAALAGMRGKVLGCRCCDWPGRGHPPAPCHAVALARAADGLEPYPWTDSKDSLDATRKWERRERGRRRRRLPRTLLDARPEPGGRLGGPVHPVGTPVDRGRPGEAAARPDPAEGPEPDGKR